MADEDDYVTHHEALKKEYMEHHNKMMDRFRSIDQILKEGSSPSASSRFASSSPRDDGISPLGGQAK
jgi:hypothetical protein